MISEGQVPNNLLTRDLNGRFENLSLVRDKIEQIFEEGKLFPRIEYSQAAYEVFCRQFRTDVLQLDSYIEKDVLIFKNIPIPDTALKALCLVIPLIRNIKGVVFENNQINDFMAACMFISCFMSPTLTSIVYTHNQLKSTASATFYELQRTNPSKI